MCGTWNGQEALVEDIHHLGFNKTKGISGELEAIEYKGLRGCFLFYVENAIKDRNPGTSCTTVL